MKKVISFLRLASCYYHSIEKFSIIVAPSTMLTHKDVKFLSPDDNERDFQELKVWLSIALDLTIPMLNSKLMAFIDTSAARLEYVLIKKAKVVVCLS